MKSLLRNGEAFFQVVTSKMKGSKRPSFHTRSSSAQILVIFKDVKALVIPEQTTIQLVDESRQAVRCENILLYIKTNATTKADYHLGPFASDRNGAFTISKADFEREIETELATGFLDFEDIETHEAEVEIRLYTQEEIEKFIESRSIVYPKLLDGEDERWSSIDELINFLMSANNLQFNILTTNRSIAATFNDSQEVIEIEMVVTEL